MCRYTHILINDIDKYVYMSVVKIIGPISSTRQRMVCLDSLGSVSFSPL